MRSETTSLFLVKLLFFCPVLEDTYSASKPVGERGEIQNKDC